MLQERTMQVRIITVEREYGSGGALIARQLADRLGWKHWDEALTAEIARIAKVDPRAARLCDERVDPLVYRLFKVFARGSYERALSIEESKYLDTDWMVDDVAHRDRGRRLTRQLRDRRPRLALYFARSARRLPRFHLCASREKNPPGEIDRQDRDGSNQASHRGPLPSAATSFAITSRKNGPIVRFTT